MGEARAWETDNKHGGKTLHRRWRVDENLINEERIIMNGDGTCRSRVVTTWKDCHPCMAMIYRGFSTPWRAEKYTQHEDGGETVVLRDMEGKIVATIIRSGDKTTSTQFLDGDGNPMTQELYDKLLKESQDL